MTYLLVGIRRKQAVLDKDSDGLLDARHILLIVDITADFVDGLPVGDDDDLALEEVEGIDGTVDAGEALEAADGKVGIELSKVSCQELLGRVRDRLSLATLRLWRLVVFWDLVWLGLGSRAVTEWARP